METWWIIRNETNGKQFVVPISLFIYNPDAIGPYWTFEEAKKVIDYWNK